MAKELFPHKIIWLASYPKSGNTWFRAFLTALLNDGEVEINDMETDGIFSSREIFEGISDIDSRDLYEEEMQLMLPTIYRQLAHDRKRLSIIKVHDAFSYNSEGQPIIPEDVTHCAIYLIRNPLDVVGSYANHNNCSIDTAIAMMNDKNGGLARQHIKNLNLSNQLQQLMYSWSGHVLSWVERPKFPVYLVRYEDMLTNTFETFSKAVKNIGWNYSEDRIKAAIEASSFQELKKQEAVAGFREKNRKSPVFFRGGTMGNWKQELTAEQAQKITSAHAEVMGKYGYRN